MKQALFILLLFISVPGYSQPAFNPNLWAGSWKGELLWYKAGQNEPQKVSMELRIHSLEAKNSWSWQIIYGKDSEDNRPYTLKQKDSIGVHWVIDENNGILLDQFWVGGKFSGAFTVMNSTIFNSYWMEGDTLLVEFYTIQSKPEQTSGKGTVESPKVDSYRMKGYQKAILKRL